MVPWLTRIASLLLVLVLVLVASPALASPPSAEQLCRELVDTQPGGAHAIEACERAHAEEASPRTSAALAVALAESGGDHYARVYDLLVAADSGSGTAPEVLGLMLRAATSNDQGMLAWELHDRLAKRAGDDYRLHALLLAAALDQDRNFKAARHLRRLRELDPPAAELELLERLYDEQVPAWIDAIAAALASLRFAALAWLVLSLATFTLASGIALVQRRAVGAWTPRSADEPPQVPLRKLAHLLLRTSVVVYWSALLLIALVLLLCGLAFLGLALVLPGIFKGTALFVAAFTVAAIAMVIRAARFGDVTVPGMHLQLDAEPELMALSYAAASAMGVPPAVDLYFTTTDARLEVLALRRRTLVLGIAVLEALDTDQFNPLLCREYARTREGGGAGHLVAPILLSMKDELWWQTTPSRFANPGWYLLLGFHRLYRFMASGAAREQDLLADRRTAAACGSNRLADAIVSLADVQVRFDASLVAIEAELPRRGGLLANIYTHEPEPRPSEQALAAELDRRLGAGDSLTDGMSINSRIARLEALVLPPPTGSASVPPRPLAQQVRIRADLHVWGTNDYRIKLERRLNKFIKLEPELEAVVSKG
jgi:hypothetical protein